MNPNALLQNKNVIIGGIAAIVVILILVIVLSVNKPKNEDPTIKKPEIIKEDVKLLTTTSVGTALELQALLARDGVTLAQRAQGSKIELWLQKDDKITTVQRDNAIITIVKSGIMDKNIGLEIFDKGDFTSSREDKRIRLARAVNGELARLIKKIPGIKDASVFVAIPKDTIFTSMKKPTTATVQLVLAPDADRLDRNIIRTIKNLLIGSVEGLDAKNISITDTNGNVYSSVLDATDDMMKLLEDQDNYMKKKVIAQLDKLIGQGNYVVTVSTYLREIPSETAQVIYNPEESSIGNKQRFSENLGDSSHDKNRISGAVSTHLPKDLIGPESKANRNYNRQAEEFSYKVGQKQVSEVKNPGILEEISIAVTLSKGTIPAGTTVEELKELIARAASPKAESKNVQIAFSDKIKPLLSQERPVQLPQPESSGNPWWTIAAILGAALFVGLVFISGRAKDSEKKQQQEISLLKEIAQKQEQALQDANNRALALHEAQQKMYQQLTERQQQSVAAIQDQQRVQQKQNIEEVEVVEDVDEQEFATTLKSWIES